MNTKWFAALALVAVVSSAFAQQGPPAGGPPQGGPSRGGMGGGRPASASQGAAAHTTETVRLLSLSSVQNDLGLTLAEWAGVNAAIRSLKGADTSEDGALAVVSKALTAAQTARLKELLVQDLGYGSLALSDVRALVALTADQAKSISALLATLDTAKKALLAANAPAKTVADLQAQTNAQLAKLLTPEQDAKLRALAGRNLGSHTLA